MNICLRNIVNSFVVYFCFHLSINHLVIVDWGKYRRWWNILNFSIKTLMCFLCVLFLPSSQASFCTLEALFFLFVCFFLPTGPLWAEGWECFFRCLYSHVTHLSGLSYSSLCPFLGSWCSDIQMSHQMLFFFGC